MAFCKEHANLATPQVQHKQIKPILYTADYSNCAECSGPRPAVLPSLKLCRPNTCTPRCRSICSTAAQAATGHPATLTAVVAVTRVVPSVAQDGSARLLLAAFFPGAHPRPASPMPAPAPGCWGSSTAGCIADAASCWCWAGGRRLQGS
eukprot:1154418-Pelagomonas_calceolata.AAC.3